MFNINVVFFFEICYSYYGIVEGYYMGKIKKLILFIFVIFLTGCSSYDMSMEISKNKEMDFVITILSGYENSELADSVSIYKEKLEQYGFSVSEYNEDNKYGMIISKKYDNIDKISNGKRSEEFDLLYFYNNDYSSNVESKMFNVDKGFDTNRYAANFYVDLSSLDIDLSNAVVTFKVSVPNGTINNNANRSDDNGNNLTWNISSLGKTEIDFVFELKSYDYIYYGIAIIVVFFLVFSIFGTLFSKSGDENNNNKQLELDKKIEYLKNNNLVESKQTNFSNNNSFMTKEQYLEFQRKRNNVSTIQNNFNNNVNNNINTDFNVNSNFNSNNNSDRVNNSLVPELGKSNVKVNNPRKRRGLFRRKKKKVDNSDVETSFVNTNVNFSAMIDNISDIQNTSLNKNVDISNAVNNLNDDITFVGGDNGYIQKIDQGESGVNNISVNNNSNLNINNSSSQVSSFDSFQYDERLSNVNNNDLDETSLSDDSIVIKLNNQDVVVDRNKDNL